MVLSWPGQRVAGYSLEYQIMFRVVHAERHEKVDPRRRLYVGVFALESVEPENAFGDMNTVDCLSGLT
jgi:hypothetical protein